jgi:hypothetical protein
LFRQLGPVGGMAGQVWVDKGLEKALLSREVDDPLPDEAGKFGPSARTVSDQMEKKLLKVFS